MKRIQYLLCMAAAATIGLAGCSKDEPVMAEPSADNFMFNIVPDDFNAAAATSRTAYDPAIGNIVWTAGDQMQLYVDMAARQSTAELTDGKASFKAYFSLTAPATINLQGAVPASAVLGVKAKDDATKKVTSLQMALPNVQNATLTTFDPAADILIAQDMSVEVTADDITAGYKVVSDFRFGRPMAITQYTFTLDNPALTADETVESVTLTVNPGQGNAEKGLTGRFYFNPGTGYFVDNTGATVDATVNPFYQGQSLNNVKVAFAEQPKLGELVMWAVTAPVKLEAGDQMIFTVKTSKNTVVKTVTLASELAFVNTQLNTAGVKLNAKNCVVTPNEVPGELTETLLNSDLPKPSSGYTTSVTETTSGWSVYHYMYSTTAATKDWIQTRYQPGTVANRSYIVSPEIAGTITQLNIFCQGSANGTIRLLDPDTEAEIASKAVPTATNGGELVFENLYDFNLSKIKIQPYPSNTSNTTVYIQSVKLTYAPSVTPKISVPADLKIEISAIDTEVGSFTYSIRNATDADVTVSVPAADTWLTAEKSSTANTVEYMAEENTGALRTSTITLSVAGGNTVEIPVTQYAPVQKLPAVTDLTATADGTKVDVSWTAVEHATGYAWRIAAASAPTTTVDGGTVEATSVIITGLEPTTAYIVSVMALGDNGATYDDSDEATVDVTTGESSGITPGPAWNYSFLGSTTAVLGTDKTGGTGTLGGYAWTAAYTWAAGSGYVAYESNNGLHIGSGSNAPKTITFSTSAYTEGIASVSISVRDTNATTASLTVTVGGTPLIYNGNESVTLTSAVTKYTFEAASPLKGEIVILIDRGSTSGKKAIYVTELGIN